MRKLIDLWFYPEGMNLKKILRDIELIYIQNALTQTRGNCEQAAKLLGINRTCLVMKRKKYGLPLQEV